MGYEDNSVGTMLKKTGNDVSETATAAKNRMSENMTVAGNRAQENKDKAMNELSEKKEEWTNYASEKKDEAKDKLNSLTSDAEDKKHEAKKTADKKASEAEDKKDELKSDAKDKADEAKKTADKKASEAEDKKDELKNDAKDKADEAKKTADKKADEASSKAQDVKETAKDKAQDAKSTAEDKFDQAKSKASELADDGAQKKEELKKEADAKAETWTEYAQEKADELLEKKDEAIEYVKETVESVKETFFEKKDEAADVASDKLEKTKEVLHEDKEIAKDKAHDAAEYGHAKAAEAYKAVAGEDKNCPVVGDKTHQQNRIVEDVWRERHSDKQRDVGPAAWSARKLLAAVSASLILISYVTCIAIAVASDTYTGGLAFPYYSDTGRDKPAYYVFATLNTVASVCMVPFMILQYYYIQAWLPDNDVKCRNIAATIFGAIAPIGSILLSIFDTSNYSEVHSYSAYVFFVFIVIHTSISLFIYKVLSNKYPATHGGVSIIVRYVIMATLLVSFLCYIPIGLALTCDWKRLSIDDCIAAVGDEAYCNGKEYSSNATLTTLWDYGACPEVNLMRSATQFVCILSLMSYIFFYALDASPLVRVLDAKV